VATRRVYKNLQQGTEHLVEKAQDIEVTIPVTKSQETRYNFDPATLLVDRFWGTRPNEVAINKALQILHILEFKKSTNRDEGFLEVKEAEANEQHKSIISALRAAALKWGFEWIHCMEGNCGSDVESDFYTKLKD